MPRGIGLPWAWPWRPIREAWAADLGGRIRPVNRRPGRRIAALVAAVALLASTLVPAHGAGAAGGDRASDVCRSQGNAMPDGLPGGHESECAACCLATAALASPPQAAAASGPPFEAPAAARTLVRPAALASANARAPPPYP